MHVLASFVVLRAAFAGSGNILMLFPFFIHVIVWLFYSRGYDITGHVVEFCISQHMGATVGCQLFIFMLLSMTCEFVSSHLF